MSRTWCLYSLLEIVAVLAVAVPSHGDLTTVSPKEIDDPLVNPYCGWGLWVGPRFYDSRQFSMEYNTTGFGDDAPLFSWVLIDWMWADLEPVEGQFNWNDLDTVINYWKARDKQFLVRLWITTDPGWAGKPGNTCCPDWLWDKGVKFHEYTGEGGVRQRCPAYMDPSWNQVYLPFMKRFLTAYRDRYHQPGSPIMMDQVMGFGDWGEWHTMWSHYPWPSRQAKRDVLAEVIGTYLEIFAGSRSPSRTVPQLSIAQVYDDDCGGETPLAEAMKRQALDVAIENGLAFSRHGYIDGMSGWPNDLILRYWQANPMIAEANWSYEQVKKEKTHGTMPEFEDTFIRYHSMFAHMYMHSTSYKQAVVEDRDQVQRALKPGGIGYRFALTSASWESARLPGQTLTLRQEWVNHNVSWCVYPYRLKLYLLDSDGRDTWSEIDKSFDPRSWLSGTTYPVESVFSLPDKLKPGTYQLRLALVDETGNPQVRLGIDGADTLLRYRLGSVILSDKEELYTGVWCPRSIPCPNFG